MRNQKKSHGKKNGTHIQCSIITAHNTPGVVGRTIPAFNVDALFRALFFHARGPFKSVVHFRNMYLRLTVCLKIVKKKVDHKAHEIPRF
jgi:hypothetical protein